MKRRQDLGGAGTWARCVRFPEASLTTGEALGLNQVGGAGAAVLAQGAASQGGILESASKGEAGRTVGKKRCPDGRVYSFWVYFHISTRGGRGWC